MNIVAIDVGTYSCLLASLDALGQPKLLTTGTGEQVLRSSVYFETEENIIVGSEAENAGLVDPGKYVDNPKRYIGTDKVLYRSKKGTEYYAKDTLAISIGSLKKTYESRTNSVLEAATLTVPANYTDKQRNETLEAAKANNLEVIKLCQEPTCGGFGNKIHERRSPNVLIVDVGGGTTDISLIHGAANDYTVDATNGIPELGGMDYSRRVFDYVLKEFASKHNFTPSVKTHPTVVQDLYYKAEQAKKTLTVRKETKIVFVCDGKILNLTVTRDQFSKMTADLNRKVVDCAKNTVQESGYSQEEISEIIAVGGGSLVPDLRDEIEKCLGKRPACYCDPQHAVAFGACLMGKLEVESRGERAHSVEGGALPPSSVDVEDITQNPIGVGVITNDNRVVNSVIISKGQRIPSQHKRAYKLSSPGQSSALIAVYQGKDGECVDDCQKLGYFELKELEPVYDRPHRIDIKLVINRNGMLHATAEDSLIAKSAELTIDYGSKGEGR